MLNVIFSFASGFPSPLRSVAVNGIVVPYFLARLYAFSIVSTVMLFDTLHPSYSAVIM